MPENARKHIPENAGSVEGFLRFLYDFHIQFKYPVTASTGHKWIH